MPRVGALERELLCLCARSAQDAETGSRVRSIARSGPDWDGFLIAAHRHHVLPLCYRSLTRLAGADLPEPVMGRLRGAFHGNVRRNLFLTRELFEVMDLLRAEGIRSIPYKGPAVACQLYRDLSLRQFADLDVIVGVKDVVSAIRVLERRGYRLEKARSEEQLRAYLGSGKDVTLLRADGLVNLEIHWAITTEKDPIRIRPASLWQGLRPLTMAGTRVQTFGLEWLLLLLCIHGAKHLWEKLGWLCDVAEIVRSQPALDWDVALDKAAETGASRILLLGLGLSDELLGARPPARILDAITADKVVMPLRSQIRSWLFEGTGDALDLGERERYFMRLRERPSDRCRVALTQAKHYLTPTLRDRETLPLPQYLGWSLYLLRPVRLAGEYGFAPLKRFVSGLFQS